MCERSGVYVCVCVSMPVSSVLTVSDRAAMLTDLSGEEEGTVWMI